MRDPNAAELQPAVAKYRDTARQAAAKKERHDPRTPRKGLLRPGLLTLHMVQSSWPRSRSQMLRICGKQPQLRNDMTSHWCSRHSLSLHLMSTP